MKQDYIKLIVIFRIILLQQDKINVLHRVLYARRFSIYQINRGHGADMYLCLPNACLTVVSTC
jgi:hypothetical protein